MEGYNLAFQSLLTKAGYTGEYRLPTYLEDVLQVTQTQSLNLEGIRINPNLTITNKFSQLQATTKLKTMAVFANAYSDVKGRGTTGFRKVTGSIPTMKARYTLNGDDFREYEEAQVLASMGQLADETIFKNLLFTSLSDVFNQHSLSLTYMRGQFASNNGIFETTTENNGGGLIGLKFDAQVPDANITTLAGNFRWFTDAAKTTEGSTSEPVIDFRSQVRVLRNKGKRVVCEVQYDSWLEDMKHTKWKEAMGYVLMDRRMQTALPSTPDGRATAANSVTGLDDSMLTELFQAVVGIPCIFNKDYVATEKYIIGKTPEAGKLEDTGFYAFNANTYAFREVGEWGEMISMRPMLPDGVAEYAVFFGGAGVMQYDYNSKQEIQDFWTKQSSIIAPTKTPNMLFLHTQ